MSVSSVVGLLLGGLLSQDGTVPDALTTYEIARAHEKIRTYLPSGSPLSVVSSEVRTLRGARGSAMTVYCGVLQTRVEGRVEQMRFYHVIDVAPAANLLSDYERGASDLVGEEESTTAEEGKLCHGPLQEHDDVRLLRTSNHRSSGSILRPFVNDSGEADRRWVVGAWTFQGECASDNGMHLDSDGSYRAFDESGRWSLSGDLLTIQVEEEHGEEGTESRRLKAPRLSPLRIIRAGVDRMNVRYPDATTAELIRC